MKRSLYLTLGLIAVLLIGIACSDNEARPAPAATGTARAIPTAEAAAQIDFISDSGIVGADPEFNLSALVWQGYWLSRDHFGPFVMGSGAGIPFEPPMDRMMMAMGMIAQNPDDPVDVPQNMMPLQAVFASASPNLVNDPRDFDPLDLAAFRLDPTTFDETVTIRGQAETMLKESQWARNFADPHFGDPAADFGAQQRFIGMMVSMLAQMQGAYAMQNLMGEDNLYHDSDGALDYAGNWVMLHTLSDIAGLTGEESGRYANPDAHPMFEDAATQLFRALQNREPASAREAAAAIRALIYRASTTGDGTVRDDALATAAAIADGTPASFAGDDVVENAAAIAGLISATVIEDGSTYREAADALFRRLTDDFDAGHGIFQSKDTYSVDDVAWIIGGLNALMQEGSEPSKAPAARMLLAFYESTISLGGMQLSAPPGKSGAMAGEFEMDLPDAVYYHPADTPPPPMVGKLTVPAEEITWDGSEWEVTSDRFVPAGAMHLANELNWLGPHLGSLPFPPVDGGSAPAAAGGGAPSATAVVTARNISYDVRELAVPAGREVTISFRNQDDGIPHNLHIQGGSAGDFKTEIERGPVEQTLVFTIDQPGTYTFTCDVHPGPMHGTLTVQ